MVKLIATIGTAITQDTELNKKISRTAIFKKYKTQGSLIGDFILLNDSVIEINFTDLISAEKFAQEITELYSMYNDTVTFQFFV